MERRKSFHIRDILKKRPLQKNFKRIPNEEWRGEYRRGGEVRRRGEKRRGEERKREEMNKERKGENEESK